MIALIALAVVMLISGAGHVGQPAEKPAERRRHV